VARRRSQECQEVVVWISIPYDGIRGLSASLEGIPTSTSSHNLKYVLGASRAWLEPWPCTGASLVVSNSVARGQLSNPGRGPVSVPSRLMPGSEPVYQVSGNIRLRILPRPLGGHVFLGERGRDQRGSGQRGVRLRRGGWSCAQLLRDSGKRLGKSIKCEKLLLPFYAAVGLLPGL
jgi:hypothetical protein